MMPYLLFPVSFYPLASVASSYHLWAIPLCIIGVDISLHAILLYFVANRVYKTMARLIAI